MKSLLLFVALALFAVLCGCANAPGKQLSAGTPTVPNEVSDFNILYGENCAGCHGAEGRGGAAIALGDPVYLAIADDTVLRRAATNGIPGTSMPAFAQSAGGMLTEKQIDLIASRNSTTLVEAGRFKRHESAAVLVHNSGRWVARFAGVRNILLVLPRRFRQGRTEGKFHRRWIFSRASQRSGASDNCDRGSAGSRCSGLAK